MTTITKGRHRQSFWLGFGPITMLVSVLAVLLVLTACGGTTPTAVADTPELTPLEQSREECRLPSSTVGDDGATLILDHKGEDETSGLSIEQIACVLLELNMPDAVVARLDSTRAMDGVQSGSWDGYTATWSYHPDSGVDIVIEAQ